MYSISLDKLGRNRYIIYALLLMGAIYLYSNSYEIISPADEAEYMILAKAFSIGRIHRWVSRPGDLLDNVAYPLYPIIISPVFLLFGGNTIYPRLVSVFCALGSLVLVYLIGIKYLDRKTTVFFTLLVGLSNLFVYYSTQILTEMPYLFLSLATVYLVLVDGGNIRHRELLISTILGLSILTRGSGFVLGISIIIYRSYYIVRDLVKSRVENRQDIRQKFLSLLPPAITLLVVGGLLKLVDHLTVSLSFFAQLSGGGENLGRTWNPIPWTNALMEKFSGSFQGYILDRFPLNLFGGLYHVSGFLTFLNGFHDSDIIFFSGLIIFLVTVWGFIRARNDFMKLYTFTYTTATVVLLNLNWSGRYLLPTFPFLVLYFFLGLRDITTKLSKARGENLFYTAVLILVFGSGFHAIYLSSSLHNSTLSGADKEFLHVVDWISDNTDETDLIITTHDKWVYLETGRKAISTRKLWRLNLSVEGYRNHSFYSLNPKYIVFSYNNSGYYHGPNPPEGFYKAFIEKEKDILKHRYTTSNDNFEIYEIDYKQIEGSNKRQEVSRGTDELYTNCESPLDQLIDKKESAKEINVVFILVDCLRADHVGIYGYARNTTPYIDSISNGGTVYYNVYSNAPATKASVASFFTSKYPSQHNTKGNRDWLSEDLITISEILSIRGMLTMGVIDNTIIGSEFNYNQGFDIWDETAIHMEYDNSEYVNKQVFKLLENYSGENFFLYIHYIDAHCPYQANENFIKFVSNSSNKKHISCSELYTYDGYGERYNYTYEVNLDEIIDAYDNAVLQNDYRIGEIINMLRNRSIYNKSMIIITGDHGEGFREHKYFLHGISVHSELINVPLIIKYPNQHESNKVNARVQLIDILPTVLDEVDIVYDPACFEGISLGGINDNERIIISEDLVGNKRIDVNKSRSIISGEYKYIYTEDGDKKLYNEIIDKKESQNIFNEIPEKEKMRLESLYNNLTEYLNERTIRGRDIDVDEVTLRRLRSLGYLT